MKKVMCLFIGMLLAVNVFFPVIALDDSNSMEMSSESSFFDDMKVVEKKLCFWRSNIQGLF